jgi:hypothetical protein
MPCTYVQPCGRGVRYLFLQLIYSGLPGLIDRIGTDTGARVLGLV